MRRVVVVALLLPLAGVLGLAIIDAARAGLALRDGRAALGALSRTGDVGDAAADAEVALRRAQHIVGTSPWLRALSSIPVLGTPIRTSRAVVGDGAAVGLAAAAAITRVDAAVGDATSGPARLDALRLARSSIDELDDLVASTRGHGEGDVWPATLMRSMLASELDERTIELEDASDRLEAVERLLRGPSRYLVLGANNAEMSGAVGMPLTAGVLTLRDGDMELSDFVQTSELLDPGGPDVDQPLLDLFANQGIGYDFRGTTALPDFSVMGPVLADMSSRVATGPVDGVILLDTMAVGSLVGLTGPVVVDGIQYDSQQVLYQLLVGNYQAFGDLGSRPERVEVQGDFARAVFDAVTSGDVGVLPLASALSDLARGRHLLLWSADPTLQSVWQEVGADGAVGPQDLVVAVENMDGNKLDSFIQPRVEIDAIELPRGDHQVEISVEVPVPELPIDTAPYIVGSAPEVHFAQLVVQLPSGTEILDVLEAPDRLFDRQVQYRDSLVSTSMYGTPAGQTSRYVLRCRIPAEVDALRVLPSARYRGTVYDIDGARFGDAVPFFVPLGGEKGSQDPSLLLVAVATTALLLTGVPTVAQLRRRRGR